MRAVDIILKKKSGKKLTQEEINFIINGLVSGEIPDYQISALLMGICFQGMNSEEQYFLTKAMVESGEVIDLSQIKGICVDKHSTGGVGDKTTLVIAPIFAACGLKVAKMSGRGLGHTGGTLDKLESIPGFNIAIASQDFYKQVNNISLAVIGQTLNIAPADKKLYALRDVTGTVESISLIASSIMSKKIASGAHTIILDVKVGTGAFMKTIEDARELAKAMVNIGKQYGRKVIAVLTNMDEPLGTMVGNSLEVIEAIETLKGAGDQSFRELCLDLCAQMLLETGLVKTLEEGFQKSLEKITSNEALEKFKEMVLYQGGNPSVIDNYDLFGKAKEIIPVNSLKDGYVHKIDALEIGLAAMVLGAGRSKKEDSVDLSVGVKVMKKVGDYVDKNTPLAYIYTNGVGTNEAISKIQNAYTIMDTFKEKEKIILDIIK